jgi:uncharacterized protein (DUF2267 family)
MSESDLLDLVCESPAFDTADEADRTIDATLRALAASISRGEARDIADRLPDRYAASLRAADGGDDSRPLDRDAFIERVRDEAGIGRPREKIRAVLAGLTTVVGEAEMDNARAQLPPEYGTLFGPASIEPGRTFVDVVADEGGLDHETAATAARETLGALGRRLSAGEARDIAPYLRGEASDWLARTATHDAEDLSVDEFLSTIARRADVPEARAREYAAAVGDALAEAVPEDERQRAEAQIPDQYAAVMDLAA